MVGVLVSRRIMADLDFPARMYIDVGADETIAMDLR